MKKRTIGKILACLITASMVFALPGCGNGDISSIEEEVASALSDKASSEKPEEETQPEEESEPESALEYIDVPDPDASQMTDSELDIVEMEVTEADNQGNTESTTESTDVSEKDGVLQIVFIGDSIYDAVRDETGIAHLVGENLKADVYNLAIGGTTAGLRKDKSFDKATWNEPNFTGVVYTMQGEINNGLLDNYKSGEVMKTLKPEYTDYFIIDYGTNDFLWYIPLGTSDSGANPYFYYRTALDLGISALKDKYPHAKIILCAPYYEEFWSADRSRYIGDIHSVNNGYGTLLDYISVMGDAARDYGCVYLNMYDLLGIDQNNVNDMTVDGIHPSEMTRAKYADILTDTIKSIEDGTYEWPTDGDK